MGESKNEANSVGLEFRVFCGSDGSTNHFWGGS